LNRLSETGNLVVVVVGGGGGAPAAAAAPSTYQWRCKTGKKHATPPCARFPTEMAIITNLQSTMEGGGLAWGPSSTYCTLKRANAEKATLHTCRATAAGCGVPVEQVGAAAAGRRASAPEEKWRLALQEK